jgi:hypothetical protein
MIRKWIVLPAVSDACPNGLLSTILNEPLAMLLVDTMILALSASVAIPGDCNVSKIRELDVTAELVTVNSA